MHTAHCTPNLLYTNLPLTATLHCVMRYLIVSSFPSLTASPSGVSPSLVTAPIVSGDSDSPCMSGMYNSETITNENTAGILMPRGGSNYSNVKKREMIGHDHDRC